MDLDHQKSSIEDEKSSHNDPVVMNDCNLESYDYGSDLFVQPAQKDADDASNTTNSNVDCSPPTTTTTDRSEDDASKTDDHHNQQQDPSSGNDQSDDTQNAKYKSYDYENDLYQNPTKH